MNRKKAYVSPQVMRVKPEPPQGVLAHCSIGVTGLADANPAGFCHVGQGLALDIGCHVGGFTALQAQRSRFVFGVDISFERLLLASQILKGRPKRLDRYRLYQEGRRYDWRRLNAPSCQNVEFVVAAGGEPPF